MDEATRARRSNRLRFLRRLYELSDADVGSYQDGREIADAMGIPLSEAGSIIRYHEERGHLKQMGGAGLTLRITAEGIDFIEEAREEA